MIQTMRLTEILEKQKMDFEYQVKNIFFLSSSIKEFSSPERKVAFFKRWCGDYMSHYPEHFLVMYEEDKVLGYMSGCLDSSIALAILEVPGFQVFADQFKDFPAHLHINFHPDARGRGLGSKLINEFIFELKEKKISGVHLVTSPGAANISFYQRLGFSYEIPREFNQMNLLFMGKKLNE